MTRGKLWITTGPVTAGQTDIFLAACSLFTVWRIHASYADFRNPLYGLSHVNT